MIKYLLIRFHFTKASDPINIKTGNVVLTDNGKSATAPLILSGDTIDYVGHGFFTGDEVYYKPDEFVEYDASGGEPPAITTTRNLGVSVKEHILLKN